MVLAAPDLSQVEILSIAVEEEPAALNFVAAEVASVEVVVEIEVEGAATVHHIFVPASIVKVTILEQKRAQTMPFFYDLPAFLATLGSWNDMLLLNYISFKESVGSF